MYTERPNRGIDYWFPETPKGSEAGSNSRSVSDNQSQFFTSPADCPQRNYNLFFKSACYYARGLLLLSTSGGAIVGAFYTGEKIDDRQDAGYIAATIFLALLAALTFTLGLRHFFLNKKPEFREMASSQSAGYRQLNP